MSALTAECTRVLEHPTGPLPPALEAHLATCPGCRAARAALDALGDAPPPAAPAHLAAAAHAELAAHPRATPWWRELALLLATYALVLGADLVVLQRALTRALHVMPLEVSLLALVGAGAFLALSPRRRGWGAVLLVVAAGACALAVFARVPQLATPGPLVRRGDLVCGGSHLLLSALPLAAALVLLARSAYSPVRAVIAGLSAGAVGLALLHLRCPASTLRHLAVGHLVPWLLLAFLAWRVRRRMPSRSFAP